jgi:hypothetical protein
VGRNVQRTGKEKIRVAVEDRDEFPEQQQPDDRPTQREDPAE